MFAQEGYPFILGAAALATIAFALALRLRSWPLWLVAIVLIVIALWVAWFFRDPVRKGERGDNVAVAPAAGRIVLITNINEPTFVVVRKAGQFLNAVTEASSSDNEPVSVGIVSGRHRILTRQNAGLIARRIITDSNVVDTAVQGSRPGLLRFGSRVDVFLPPDSTLRVKLGQRTVAGSTVLADLPTP